jgi:hypothetical protein
VRLSKTKVEHSGGRPGLAAGTIYSQQGIFPITLSPQRGETMRKIHTMQLPVLLCFLTYVLALGAFAQVPGGYRLVPNDDSESVAAAKAAVRQESQKLGKNIVFSSIVYAQRQVVSGTNYKLCLKVKVNGTSKRAETVINRDLQKQYSLTSWNWGQCTKPAELKTSPASPSGQ